MGAKIRTWLRDNKLSPDSAPYQLPRKEQLFVREGPGDPTVTKESELAVTGHMSKDTVMLWHSSPGP